MEKRLMVVFDDGCSTCTVGKNIAARLDSHHAIDFIGMNTEKGKELVERHRLNMNISAYSIGENGISQKSAMIREVLSRNGIIGALFSLPFRIPWIADKFYDVLALHRKHVTKTDIPS